MRVLICGGGVIGTAIAWFLAARGAQPVVIERAGVACAASGKSGGFLAEDWCDGTPLQQLARRSFALHAELAEGIGRDWGYRRLDTYSGSVGGRHRAGGRRSAWLAEDVAIERRIGDTATTAQVIPEDFTKGLMRAAEARGGALVNGRVTGIGLTRDGSRVRGAEVDGRLVEGDAIVIAMGPWTLLAAAWLPLPIVYGLKGHSLIFDTRDDVPAEAMFLEWSGRDGETHSPEIFPRPDGTTWVCAVSSDAALPVDPSQVVPDPGAAERLHEIAAALSPALARAPVLVRQACFRPVARDGLPLMGAVPGVAGAYVATGHNVWGILNAPATGEAMADLILDSVTRAVDLTPFAPGRMPAFDARRKS
ncbi:MAG: NAD(P)/FAD-dependent oxidoreductase [Alphaproteobacteria bacterium]